jgi:hypothetical protein
MQTYSLSAWVELKQFKTWTFFCSCKECNTFPNTIKIDFDRLPEVAKRLGYPDMITKKDLDNISHRMLKLNRKP